MVFIIVPCVVLLVVAFLGFNRIFPLAFQLHKPVNQKSGIAIEEYDVVSYFYNSKPVKGYAAYPYEWKGAVWLFSTQKNLETFKSSPESYEPKYGGYCTKAISSGFAAPANPEVWTIKDNKLFFFSSKKVKDNFLNDSEELIKMSDKKWASQ